MKFYIYSCPFCTWKGNRAHMDGQCPVCGHGLDIEMRQRRFSSDLSPKLRVSGLSADKKIFSAARIMSLLKNLTGFEDE